MASVRSLALALVCGSLAFAASAQAAPTWLSSFPVSAPGTDNAPLDAAMGPNGDAGAIWRETDTPNDHIVAALRPAGGSLGALQTLSTNGDTPRIGVDAAGDAVAVWYDAAAGHIQFSRAAAGGTFAPGQEIPGQTTTATDADLALAVAPNGEAICAWRDSGSVSVSIAPPGAGFGSPQVFIVDNPSDVQLAIASTGEALFAFRDGSGAHTVARAAVRPPGGVFGSPGVVSPTDEDADGVSVALNAAGDGVVAWPGLVSVSHLKPEAVFLTAAGGFSSVKDIDSTETQTVGGVSASIDSAGLVRALWTPGPFSGQSLLASTAPVGGSFSTPAQTLSTSPLTPPTIASDPAGDTIATWQDNDGSFNRIAAAVAPAGQPFGSTKFIDPGGQHSDNGPSPAMDAQGDGIVAWPLRDSMTGNDAIQIAGYDAAGPQLRGLSIPSAAVVNTPLNFSVAPVDVWSQVTSTQWTFGDGQSSGSPTPVHLFSAAGTFTASLTATDALGNSSSASGPIVVAPAPPVIKPRISKAKLSSRRFLAPRHRGASLATAVGARVRFTLNEPATVHFRVEHCTKVRRGKCRRYKLMKGSFSKAAHAGGNSVRFMARLRRRPLRPGLYRLDVQAVHGNVKSKTTRLAFQIVKPRRHR